MTVLRVSAWASLAVILAVGCPAAGSGPGAGPDDSEGTPYTGDSENSGCGCAPSSPPPVDRLEPAVPPVGASGTSGYPLTANGTEAPDCDADSVYVDGSAGDGGDGSADDPVSSIEEALELAEPEALVCITAGEYAQDLVLEGGAAREDKAVTIRRLGDTGEVVLTGAPDRDGGVIRLGSDPPESALLYGLVVRSEDRPAFDMGDGGSVVDLVRCELESTWSSIPDGCNESVEATVILSTAPGSDASGLWGSNLRHDSPCGSAVLLWDVGENTVVRNNTIVSESSGIEVSGFEASSGRRLTILLNDLQGSGGLDSGGVAVTSLGDGVELIASQNRISSFGVGLSVTALARSGSIEIVGNTIEGSAVTDLVVDLINQGPSDAEVRILHNVFYEAGESSLLLVGPPAFELRNNVVQWSPAGRAFSVQGEPADLEAGTNRYSPAGPFGAPGGDEYGSLSAYQEATGGEVGSTQGPSEFDDSSDVPFSVDPTIEGSSLVDRGADLDLDREVCEDAPDLGWLEYCAP